MYPLIWVQLLYILYIYIIYDIILHIILYSYIINYTHKIYCIHICICYI